MGRDGRGREKRGGEGRGGEGRRGEGGREAEVMWVQNRGHKRNANLCNATECTYVRT